MDHLTNSQVNLRGVMKMPDVEIRLSKFGSRWQEKRPVTVRESPPRKQDDALRCLPPDSGRCPLFCPHITTLYAPQLCLKHPNRFLSSSPSYLQTGHVAKGGAAPMGLGYPGLKVSRVDRPYLPWPPAWLPGNHGLWGSTALLGFT